MVDNNVEGKKDEQIEALHNLHQDKGKQVSTKTSSSSASNPEVPYEPRALFPERLRRPSHFGKQWEKIPLIDAIKQISAYAKFLKDLCTQEGKIWKHFPKKVILTKQVCSSI